MTTETKIVHIRRVREAATRWMHCPPTPPPPGQHCREVFPKPLVPPVGKENQRGKPAPPLMHFSFFLGAPTLILNDEGCRGNLCGSTIGIWLWWWKRGGACNSQNVDLGQPGPYLQNPSNNSQPAVCSSAEPSWGSSMSREHSGFWVVLWCFVFFSLGHISL